MGQPKYKNGFKYTEHVSNINLPLTWKKPKKIFVNSMSDMFHEESDQSFVAQCFDVMIKADWHTYQILTKRPRRMIEFSKLFCRYFGDIIPQHIWMGTSVENKDYAYRIDELRQVRCKIRFVSFEPLLGSIADLDLSHIDWAIIGGESGKSYRPVQKEWILKIISQCHQQNVSVFFKQWGGIRPKSGGRKINGTEYNEYPDASHAVQSEVGTKFFKKI